MEFVAEVEAGASAASVARRRGLNLRTLQWWMGVLRREARGRAHGPRILPVVVAPEVSAVAVEVSVGPFAIRVPHDADLEFVVRLAARLRAEC